MNETPLVSQRSALVLLIAGLVAVALGVLIYAQFHNAPGAFIAAIVGFGGAIAIVHKLISTEQ
ncbi:hypothetical protein [Lentzea sp. CA-135723]|uniref:hypothetical protein n=1 Tax=Lentzea sp. CA-135723 TaxID=3239950 RepID=UPI003D8C5937